MADPTLADVLAAIAKLSQQNEKQAEANAAKTTAEAEKIRDEVARSAVPGAHPLQTRPRGGKAPAPEGTGALVCGRPLSRAGPPDRRDAPW